MSIFHHSLYRSAQCCRVGFGFGFGLFFCFNFNLLMEVPSYFALETGICFCHKMFVVILESSIALYTHVQHLFT